MENNDLLDQGMESQAVGGGLTSEDKGYLDTAAKWSKFLGIVGFVFSALFVLLGFWMMFVGSSIGALSGNPLLGSGFGAAIGVFYILFALPFFFMSLYMYRFATKTKTGLYTSNPASMTDGFMNLRNYFRLYGILMAIRSCYIL